jgi:hypothetical protein
MRRKELQERLIDLIWPALVSPPKKDDGDAFKWPDDRAADDGTLEAAYNLLKDELKSEDDRAKVIESKLLSISSLVPVAMTVTVAMVTFLTSGRAGEFTRTSILIVGAVGAYVALQFLRASLAAINGLGRRSYVHIETEELAPKSKEKKAAYLQRICGQMTQVLAFNREVINTKVDQLALGHEAIRNAVRGLLVLLLVILLIVALDARP